MALPEGIGPTTDGSDSAKDIPTNIQEISVLEKMLIDRPDAFLSFIDAWVYGGVQYVICYVWGSALVYRFEEVVELAQRLNISQSRIIFASTMSGSRTTNEIRAITSSQSD